MGLQDLLNEMSAKDILELKVAASSGMCNYHPRAKLILLEVLCVEEEKREEELRLAACQGYLIKIRMILDDPNRDALQKAVRIGHIASTWGRT